jgi:hypothetical protein
LQGELWSDEMGCDGNSLFHRDSNGI